MFPNSETTNGNFPPSSLSQNGKLAAALLESAPQAIIGCDHTGRIALANRRAEEMFGYSREQFLGAPIEMLLPDSELPARSRQPEDIAQPHALPAGIGMDLAGRRQDGSDFPVEVSLSSLKTEEGKFAIAFVSDISQRKLLETQLMQAQKMEAVGRLAGGVAHDFNNMLTVISGYGRMILDDLSSVDPLREYAEEMLKAAERAGALTTQLLAFSRRQVMQPRVISVNAVITQTEKMLHRLIGEDIELVLGLDPDNGNILADPGHLEHALVNLAVNARDAMPTGGRITIETANVVLDETNARTLIGVQPGEFVIIAMTDTGHGMDAETRHRIFEPFFTTKAQGKGTGLGLATVYGTVKQTGGDIWVNSDPGKGTTFRLYFPRVEGPAEPPSTSVPVAKPLACETILVVEDEAAVRELTVKMLQRLGYTVLAAASGTEAIEISRAHPQPIALLLTDVVMPNMSGRQVADALLKTRPALKTLFLSGYTENTVLHHGVLDYGVEFLPKPFSREALSKKLQDILGRR